MVDTVVKVVYGKPADGVQPWYLAIVVVSTASTGPKSFRCLWLAETVMTDLYELECSRQAWAKPLDMGRHRILGVPNVVASGEGEERQWRLVPDSEAAQREEEEEEEEEEGGREWGTA